MADLPAEPRTRTNFVVVQGARSKKRPDRGVQDPREFRKTNEAIGLRLREGRLSLLSRKLLNVMMYHAQGLKQPGLNAPIDTPAAKKYFWVPLADLARDAAYGSKDVEFLKQQIEELQNVRILMEDDRRWTSENLVASVTFVNPGGANKFGGRMWFGFAFPPEVHEMVMAPGTYTRLSIVYQGLLRSGPALALYEVCRRYASNPSKLTFIETCEYWHGVLTGSPVSENTTPYKYLKRDVIKPAMAEINALTDIQVELIEYKNGRRVERLQFKVEPARQPHLDFPAPPVVDLDLMGRIMEFGFSQQEASDIVAQYGDDKIRASIAIVQARKEQKGVTPLSSLAAYFKWALRSDLMPASALLAPKKGSSARGSARNAQTSLMDRFLAARAADALSIHMEQTSAEQAEVLARFWAQNKISVLKRGTGLDNAMVRAAFSRWYAMDLWGEPSTQALAAYVEKMEQTTPSVIDHGA